MSRAVSWISCLLAAALLSALWCRVALAYLPGPDTVRQCPACGKPVLEKTILSGNTLGRKLWTDGRQEAPMLPDQPALVKCPHCAHLFWLGEAKKLYEGEDLAANTDVRTKWPGARYAVTPSEADYYLLLQRPPKTDAKEKYLRKRALWAANDRRRDPKGDAPPALTGEATRNLEALYALLGKSELAEDRILRAEIARELGRFSDSLRLLDHSFPPENAWAAVQIRALAQTGDPQVRLLQENGPRPAR